MKTIEVSLRDRILFIGNEIPESLAKDHRMKFVVLGCPQDVLAEMDLMAIEKKSLREALRKCRLSAGAIRDIHWGPDGDCGAHSHAEMIEDVCQEALK